jgi:two-component system phosphate regulon sensor histidine kinase PhoR
LLLACAGLNLAAAVLFGFAISRWQAKQLDRQVDRELRAAALLVRSEMAEQMTAGRSDELQRRVRQLGAAGEIRFTLLGIDGTVLADSEKAAIDDANVLENMRSRPEVQEALAHGEGETPRTRAAGQAPYHYFALRVDVDEKPIGIVRAGRSPASIGAQAAEASRLIWGLVGSIFLCVFVLSAWIAGQVMRPLATLGEAAAAIAQGDYQHRAYVPNRDELGALAQMWNRIGQELHQRLTQLSQSHDRHAAALGGMIEGVIAVDERQRIVLANKAAGRLLDFRPAAVEGRPLLEVVRSHAIDQAVSAAIATRTAQRIELGQEGVDRLVADVHVAPLPGDPCPGVVLVIHDTGELRRLESLRRDFIANVSHELKTPLSAIRACAETLRDGALDDRDAGQRFLARIEEQSDRLHRLILDMLSLARIESGQQAFEIEPVDVGEVAMACADSHRRAAEAKRIHLAIEPDLPYCRVQADREGLREILDNLVDNAVKYTPEGGSIWLRWRVNGRLAQIDVADTGIGIGEKDRRRVFERFYRVDRARSRELGGTGLGLAIVKHLAQSFGGSVGVESERGQGSTFSVELPLA